MREMKNLNRAGFTLVEIIIALGVASLLAGATMSSSLFTTKSNMANEMKSRRMEFKNMFAQTFGAGARCTTSFVGKDATQPITSIADPANSSSMMAQTNAILSYAKAFTVSSMQIQNIATDPAPPLPGQRNWSGTLQINLSLNSGYGESLMGGNGDMALGFPIKFSTSTSNTNIIACEVLGALSTGGGITKSEACALVGAVFNNGQNRCEFGGLPLDEIIRTGLSVSNLVNEHNLSTEINYSNLPWSTFQICPGERVVTGVRNYWEGNDTHNQRCTESLRNRTNTPSLDYNINRTACYDREAQPSGEITGCDPGDAVVGLQMLSEHWGLPFQGSMRMRCCKTIEVLPGARLTPLDVNQYTTVVGENTVFNCRPGYHLNGARGYNNGWNNAAYRCAQTVLQPGN